MTRLNKYRMNEIRKWKRFQHHMNGISLPGYITASLKIYKLRQQIHGINYLKQIKLKHND